MINVIESRNTTCGLSFQNSSTCKLKLLFLNLNVKSENKISIPYAYGKSSKEPTGTMVEVVVVISLITKLSFFSSCFQAVRQLTENRRKRKEKRKSRLISFASAVIMMIDD